MALGEFELIRRYFSSLADGGRGLVLGVGDDAAVTVLEPGEQLVTCTDTLVRGVHFPDDAAPRDIATRALCVNLSDLAAMGATPRWYTLALTLDAADEDWLREFAAGLSDVSRRHGCALIGGDTTRGPLCISITAMGSVPAGRYLSRGGARPGDAVYATGRLGEGAAALAFLQRRLPCTDSEATHLHQRFYCPAPRLNEGLLLRSLASAAIDISDGLLADAGHIATASDVGVRIDVDCLPLPEVAAATPDALLRWALTGGDDYELCFTVPPDRFAAVEALIAAGDLMARRIGAMVEGSGVECYDRGNRWTPPWPLAGYRHF